MINKRGQVAIFIIIAVVIVVGILLIFTVRDTTLESEISPEKNPEAYVEKCLKDSTEEVIEIMLPQGGFVEPRDFKLYNDTKVGYLCKHLGNYRPCLNHHPMYLNDLKTEITTYVKPRVEQCLLTIKNEFEKRGYTVVLSDVNLSIDLSPGIVKPTMTGRVAMTRGAEARSFENIEAKVYSPLYDLARVAMDIVNSEAELCYFEYVGYVANYPKFKIEKTGVSDSTKIYMITDRESEVNNKLNIAIRGCVIPQGI